MNELNGLHIAVLVISGLIFFLLMLYLIRTGSSSSSTTKKHQQTKSTNQPPPEPTRPCPLCKAPLKRGETVHSVLFPGTPDSLMEIYGCPFCEAAPKGHENPGSKNKRICPVCKKEMPPEAILIARVFEKPEKKHVHVLGCSNCYRGPSKTRT